MNGLSDGVVAIVLTLLVLGIVSLVGICVSFVNVRLAHVVFLSTPLLYISHQSVDAHWSELVENDDSDG